MSIGISIIIFFLSILALLAEVTLFLIVGLGAFITAHLFTVFFLPYFFVGLMVATTSFGFLAPLCAFIEFLAKKENLGYQLLIILTLIVIVIYNFYVISLLQ